MDGDRNESRRNDKPLVTQAFISVMLIGGISRSWTVPFVAPVMVLVVYTLIAELGEVAIARSAWLMGVIWAVAIGYIAFTAMSLIFGVLGTVAGFMGGCACNLVGPQEYRQQAAIE